MKKIIFFLIGVSISFCSCNTEDTNIQNDISTKELVKKAIIEFDKSAVKTGKYEGYLFLRNKEQQTEDFALERMELLVQNFLSEQTPEFIDVYTKLVNLGITADEFRTISSDFEYLRLEFQSNNKEFQCCGDSPRATLLDSFFDFICGCDDGDDENEDEE